MEKESEKLSNSVVVGITGGIGTGKSGVAKFITGLGYKVIKTDDRAKELMKTDDGLIKELKVRFGEQVYLADGSINSAHLSSLVFGESEVHIKNLETLNSIVHPHAIDDMISQVEQYENAGEKLIFVESALIYEAGLEDGFDYVIVVYAPKDIVISRLKKSGKLTEAQIEQRMNSQISQDDKVQWADFVIDNSGSVEDLRKSVEFIINILKNLGSESE